MPRTIRCFYCDVRMTRWRPGLGGVMPPHARTIDHVFAQKTHLHRQNALNTVECCNACNTHKGHLDPLDWLVIMPSNAGARRLAALLYKLDVPLVEIDSCMARRKR